MREGNIKILGSNNLETTVKVKQEAYDIPIPKKGFYIGENIIHKIGDKNQIIQNDRVVYQFIDKTNKLVEVNV